ncbi:hypothetical protein LZ554_004229 [Drepanopeziza brunnea f. sp. 'monogermtubi']|nr:hypothetical protein LZ554_004229 [Drepanopeziza brunnea f. sp. 'monogermtubi']
MRPPPKIYSRFGPEVFFLFCILPSFIHMMKSQRVNLTTIPPPRASPTLPSPGFSGQVARGDGKSEKSVRHTNLVNYRTQ